MFKKYLSSIRHTAAQFTVGMSAADAGALCVEFNRGRDPSSYFCGFNGSVIFITKPPGAGPTLTVEPGNWIVRMPDGSLDVHADADFCSSFCPAS